MRRKTVGPQLRFQVLMRDRFTCIYCGANPGGGGLLQVDHIVPVSAGGPNASSNLATACLPCNAGKGNSQLSASAVTEISRRRVEADERNRLAELGRAADHANRRREMRERLMHSLVSPGDTSDLVQ